MMRVGEDSSPSVDMIPWADLTSLNPVREKTHVSSCLYLSSPLPKTTPQIRLRTHNHSDLGNQRMGVAVDDWWVGRDQKEPFNNLYQCINMHMYRFKFFYVISLLIFGQL